MIPFCDYCLWQYRCDDLESEQNEEVCEWFTPLDYNECPLQEYDGRFYDPVDALRLHIWQEMDYY